MAEAQKTIAESKLRGQESLVQQLEKTIQDLIRTQVPSSPQPQLMDTVPAKESNTGQSRINLLRESI